MNPDKIITEIRAGIITSRANPKTVSYSKLAEKKHRDAEGLFLAEGVKLTREAIRNLPSHVRDIAVSESVLEKEETVQLITEAASLGIPVTAFSASAFEKISTEKSPQGVIAVVEFPGELHPTTGFSEWQEGKRLIMLEEIRDPGNLGTILRSAEALGVDGVILADCADLYQPKTVRAAMGTLFRLPVYLADDGLACIETMRSDGRRVLAAALGEHSLTLGEYETDPADCPVIGNEGHGLSDAIIRACTATVKIPMAGGTESLNASAAAVCILWEYFRSR